MISCAECGNVLMAEMTSYFTANRRFHFCDAYCSNEWHRKHETNGDLREKPLYDHSIMLDDDGLASIVYGNKH